MLSRLSLQDPSLSGVLEALATSGGSNGKLKKMHTYPLIASLLPVLLSRPQSGGQSSTTGDEGPLILNLLKEGGSSAGPKKKGHGPSGSKAAGKSKK